jgi:NAD(P)-binding Rossmann-like domain
MSVVQERPVTEVTIHSDEILSNGIKTAVKTSVSPLPLTPKLDNDANEKAELKPEFQLEEHPVDQVRDIKVGIIGAGLSGVTAATLLRAKVPGIDLTVYDKNSDIVSIS